MDEDLIEYELLAKHSVYLWEQKQKLEVALATTQLAMMEIERRRPDIMQRIILENDNADNTD